FNPKTMEAFSSNGADTESAITAGAERLHGLGVERGDLGAGADGQGGEEFFLVGMEHHHGGGIVASGEEDMILDVECQPAGPATLAGKIILGGHLECLGVHGGNLILVFQIDVQVTRSE